MFTVIVGSSIRMGQMPIVGTGISMYIRMLSYVNNGEFKLATKENQE